MQQAFGALTDDSNHCKATRSHLERSQQRAKPNIEETTTYPAQNNDKIILNTTVSKMYTPGGQDENSPIPLALTSTNLT